MVDAVHIQVTQDHIDKGEKDDICKCPVALALRERYPNATVDGQEYRLAHYNGLDFYKHGTRYYSHSQDVIDWIADFDNDNGVEPFVFIIQPHVVEIEGVGNV